KLNERSAKAVITTGTGMPGSMFWVTALNSLQNAMMFKPCWPSAGPTGGDGFALPAGICSLICPVTFFIAFSGAGRGAGPELRRVAARFSAGRTVRPRPRAEIRGGALLDHDAEKCKEKK